MADLVDAFSINGFARSSRTRLWESQVDQLAGLRARQDLQFRVYSVPDNCLVAIAAYDTLYFQVSMAPGALLWGLSFAAIDGTASDFLVQIADGETQWRLFATHVHGSQLVSSNAARLRPILVSPPRQFATGQANVEIANRQSTDRRCQLLLWVAEFGGAL